MLRQQFQTASYLSRTLTEGTMCTSSSAVDGGGPPARDLTDDLLMHIFNLLAADFGPEAQAFTPQAAGKHFSWFRRALPLVCKRWSCLLAGGGKFPWSSLVVSVESEMPRRRRPDAAAGGVGVGVGSSVISISAAASHLPPAGGAAATSTTSMAHSFSSSPGSSMPGSSPTTCAMMLFSRASLTVVPKLRSRAVAAWAESRAGVLQHLLLDLGPSTASHDFDGSSSRALEELLRAANRGSRGLRTLRLIWPDGAGGQDSYEMLGRLRGLAELHVNGLQQGFLGGTLPYLSGLSGLTRLSFTPKTFQFPVSVPALPTNLRVLHLTNLWISRLPPLSASAPHLRELHLRRCHLVDGLLAALAGSPSLEELRLDGSRLTGPREELRTWEAASGPWPHCPALRRLSLADCGLRALPGPVLGAFPALQALDLSNNQDLGGVVGVPDAAAVAAAASCLPPELSQLSALSEVRLAKCGLTAVPAALLAVSLLTSLDLHHNSLSALPLAPGPPLHPASPAKGSAPASSSSPRSAAAATGAGSSGPAAVAGPSQAFQHSPRSPVNGSMAASAVAVGRGVGAAAVPGTGSTGGGGGGGWALFSERLERLNIAMNRFTTWPQGLLSCTSLRELLVGELLVARAPEGELERTVAALSRLTRLEVRGESFEPRAVRALLGLQRAAAAAGRPRVEVAGVSGA